MLVTSFKVVPWWAVLVNIVCIEFILVSYSEKPSVIGCIANDFTKLAPALIALLVILAKAVAPITPRALNLAVTASTPLLKPFRFTLPAALLMPSNPLDVLLILSFSFKFLRLDKVVFTPLSKFLLSNSIWTILLSIELMR